MSQSQSMKNFELLFMREAEEFLEGMHKKAQSKLLYNLRKVQVVNDPKLLKKLTRNIWEFRSETQGNHIAYLPSGIKKRML